LGLLLIYLDAPTLVFISAAYAQDVSNVEVKATHRLSSKEPVRQAALDEIKKIPALKTQILLFVTQKA